MVLIAVISLSVMFGCAGKEFAPKDPYTYWYYHRELPEADRAVEAARQAGKDKVCPEEFKAAEDLKNKAYKEYAACHTDKAIAMANEATAKAIEAGLAGRSLHTAANMDDLIAQLEA